MTADLDWTPLTFDSLNETQAICELLTGDPSHARDRAEVVRCIFEVAAENGGLVDPNLVRPRIAVWVSPRVIPAVYNGLKARGVLVRDGWTTNDDVKGRNVGKMQRTYRLVAS